MKKIKALLIAAIAMVSMVFAVSPVVNATAAADENITAYTLDFSDENLENKVYSAYIPSAFGGVEEFGAHWTVENDVLKRVNDCGGSDVTGNYAITYLNGCYLRYFELNTKIAYGAMGLTGIAFGKKDISLRHLSDGNGLYFMPVKHGTLSLITEGIPVIALATQSDVLSKMISNVKEVRARGAMVILITKKEAVVEESLYDYRVDLPDTPDLYAPFTAAVVLQLLAYYTSAYRGLDVDQPRNLAKSVTVE